MVCSDNLEVKNLMSPVVNPVKANSETGKEFIEGSEIAPAETFLNQTAKDVLILYRHQSYLLSVTTILVRY